MIVCSHAALLQARVGHRFGPSSSGLTAMLLVVRTARQENRAARLDWFSYVHLFQDAVLSRDPGLDARSVQVQALSTADKNPQLWSRSCQAWAPGPCSFEQPWSSARSRCQAENVVFEAANFLW